MVRATSLDLSDISALRSARTALLDAIALAQRAGLPRVERLVAEEQRRRLHDALQDMKGQLRVACRIRPLAPTERRVALRALDAQRVQVLDKELPPRTFEFDSVYRALSCWERRRRGVGGRF